MELLIHDKRLLKPIDTPLFRGWVPVEEHEFKVFTGDPKFTWKGAKIPFVLWTQVCGFLRWTQKQFKEEAMVTFFYHMERREWAAWAFPQMPNGMTVKLLPDEVVFKEDRAKFGKGWIQAGSIHHHCTSGAFASGTDKDDEINKDGIHITVGKMEDAVMDFHARQVFDGTVSSTVAFDWIDCPEYLKDCPKHMKYQCWDLAIKSVPLGSEFPKEWEQRIYEPWKQRHGAGVNGLQNPPAGAHQQPTVGSTLLTKGNSSSSPTTASGSATNGHEAKKTSGSRGSSSSTAERGSGIARGTSSWEEAKVGTIKDILGRLSLAPLEALGLVTGMVDHTWTAEEIATKEALKDEIKKSGIPYLYAESIIERICGR